MSTMSTAPHLTTIGAAYSAGDAMARGRGRWSQLLANQAVGAAARGELSRALLLADRAHETADRLDEVAHQAFATALEAVVPTPVPNPRP